MKNIGAELASMDEDERRQFVGKGATGTGGQPQELDSLDDPRDYEHVGPHAGPKSEERREGEEMEAAEAGPADAVETKAQEPPKKKDSSQR
jgi:hypothetical protein